VKQDLRVCAEWDVLYGLEEEQPMSHSYKDLIVWREAKSLASTVYRATEGFPKREWYGITSQIRRAAVSVPSNIAEGQGRLTKGEFVQFLGHARGSLQEMRTQLEIAVELDYLPEAELQKLDVRSEHVSRMLNGLIDSMKMRQKAAGAQ
jgi:four helix bundle protein